MFSSVFKKRKLRHCRDAHLLSEPPSGLWFSATVPTHLPGTQRKAQNFSRHKLHILQEQTETVKTRKHQASKQLLLWPHLSLLQSAGRFPFKYHLIIIKE